jgi:superfamily II DNA or RNA helicase
MIDLSPQYIEKQVADSKAIFHRGLTLYEFGAFNCVEADPENGNFIYEVDGNYGDYTTRISLGREPSTVCDCPYPGSGCKHTVAVMLDAFDRIRKWRTTPVDRPGQESATLDQERFLTPGEILRQALEDRANRAKREKFTVDLGDMCKGEHVITTADGRRYVVTMHHPERGAGHCSCPDYLTNMLGTCKHLMHLHQHFKSRKNLLKKAQHELFPFIDIYWDSVSGLPRCFCEQLAAESPQLQQTLSRFFDDHGLYSNDDLSDFPQLMTALADDKRVRLRDSVLDRVNDFFVRKELQGLADLPVPAPSGLRAELYPYQKEGVRFAVHRKAALIGDEMGLGKTLQAITLALAKKELFGFGKVLIVTLSSLKAQWQREIDRFTDQKAVVVAGGFNARRSQYLDDDSLFKITNYEAVLRDVATISRFKPDLIILDEAQRIKNFATKTAVAVKSLPRKHALVLTGTPLENKLEDVYSIVQFLEPTMLAPLWKFAADHFLLSRTGKGKILGYHNLEKLHQRLQQVAIRRRKEQVLAELPRQITNNYYIDLHERQHKIHTGYLQALQPLLNKKYLTPVELKRLQLLLLKMRQVCNSTYLIDRTTHISPKLKELEGLLDELVVQNGHKVVIFSEWTTMTMLIGKHLSQAAIPFVELSGKIPINKRQALIDEFTSNQNCKVFLSTDAGGTGLNLQAADCVINFELPWNPARLNQRIGRVSRIGQLSSCINVVNLIAKGSIEEKIFAGIQLKTDLFKGVFDGEGDRVEFSREKRLEILNQLRELMGEEPQPAVGDGYDQEEIPEDTPHFLNPEVLAEDRQVGYADEEPEMVVLTGPEVDGTGQDDGSHSHHPDPDSHSAEKMEQVLNQGMSFLSGILEMATGRKILPTGEDGRLLHIDKTTGEVTMKFKLPGF